jgi:hypothetical protein
MRKHDSHHRHNLLYIAFAPPSTHKASSQGGIRSADPYHLKLNWTIDESSNRIDSTIHRFHSSTIPRPKYTTC